MRPILALLTATALMTAAALFADLRAQNGARTAEAMRPAVVPSLAGMAFVPAGEFLMGSLPSELNRAADVDEFPQRRVWVDDYYIDITEVTNAQYKTYVDSMQIEAPPRWIDGDYGFGEDGLPVISVSWDEARGYAAFLGKRLPSEAEWEKAARGTDGRAYPWGNSFDRTLANNSDRLMPIMSYPGGISPYGCLDMAGNAAEWVESAYDAYPRSPGDVIPQGVPDRNEVFKKDRRVYRGGSWNTFPKYLRCANRESTPPGKRWVYIGFRCAKDPEWKPKP